MPSSLPSAPIPIDHWFDRASLDPLLHKRTADDMDVTTLCLSYIPMVNSVILSGLHYAFPVSVKFACRRVHGRAERHRKRD